jgi:hypothetical protein
MPSERIQHQINVLLDEAEQAVSQLNWEVVRDRAIAVLRLDPGNQAGRGHKVRRQSWQVMAQEA